MSLINIATRVRPQFSGLRCHTSTVSSRQPIVCCYLVCMCVRHCSWSWPRAAAGPIGQRARLLHEERCVSQRFQCHGAEIVIVGDYTVVVFAFYPPCPGQKRRKAGHEGRTARVTTCSSSRRRLSEQDIFFVHAPRMLGVVRCVHDGDTETIVILPSFPPTRR